MFLLLHIFCRKGDILWWIESSKEQHLFEIEILCSIINAFTLTFIQFIVSLLNKSIIVILNFLMTSNLCIMISTKVECDTKD